MSSTLNIFVTRVSSFDQRREVFERCVLLRHASMVEDSVSPGVYCSQRDLSEPYFFDFGSFLFATRGALLPVAFGGRPSGRSIILVPFVSVS
jgi:hypothetical protein